MRTSFFPNCARFADKKDVALLDKIKNNFGGIGAVAVKGDRCSFIVSSLRQIIKVIIPHQLRRILIL